MAPKRPAGSLSFGMLGFDIERIRELMQLAGAPEHPYNDVDRDRRSTFSGRGGEDRQVDGFACRASAHAEGMRQRSNRRVPGHQILERSLALQGAAALNAWSLGIMRANKIFSE